MLFSILFTSTLAGLATAIPTGLIKRGQSPQAPQMLMDADILNYALTLEHLESAFYRQGLKNFTQKDFQDAGFNSDFYNNVKQISIEEDIHVTFITGALKSAGAQAVQECTYNFGVKDVKSFVATANILEGVGVTAYLGAAASVMAKTTLTAAATIVTVESRHSALLRQGLSQSPLPSSFDVPLSPNSVFTLAAPFIASCPPSNPTLPVAAFPPLKMGGDPSVKIQVDTEITILTPGYTLVPTPGFDLFAVFVTVAGPIAVDVKVCEGGFKAKVPKGVSGQSYVVMSSNKVTITDETTAAGPLVIEIDVTDTES